MAHFFVQCFWAIFEELAQVLHDSSANSTSLLHTLADAEKNVQISQIYCLMQNPGAKKITRQDLRYIYPRPKLAVMLSNVGVQQNFVYRCEVLRSCFFSSIQPTILNMLPLLPCCRSPPSAQNESL